MYRKFTEILLWPIYVVHYQHMNDLQKYIYNYNKNTELLGKFEWSKTDKIIETSWKVEIFLTKTGFNAVI